MARRSKIRFTKHAREKFEFVKHYGFEIDKRKVVEALENPTRIDQKGAQYYHKSHKCKIRFKGGL